MHANLFGNGGAVALALALKLRVWERNYAAPENLGTRLDGRVVSFSDVMTSGNETTPRVFVRV